MGDFSNRLTGRRGFLRGSMLFAASVAIAPRLAVAGQEQAPSGSQQNRDGDGDRGPAQDSKPAPGDSSAPTEKDPSKVTHKDADGLEYRECPQCGFNMYRQDRTWTCENCGYSYTE